jgi:hypothetical protein
MAINAAGTPSGRPKARVDIVDAGEVSADEQMRYRSGVLP